jgi:hypothetical protein
MSIIYDNLTIIGGGTHSPLLIYTQSKGPAVASFSSDGVLHLSNSFRIPNGNPGYILMSDSNGLATWTASSFASGVTGSNGTNGTSGSSGLSGTNGTSGTSGLSGTNGTSGESGTSGTSGLSGTNGTSGESGTSGTSGLSGTNGTSGSSGLIGPTGPGFNTIYTPGNNRILTSDGSNDSAIAESQLIWDGNTLTVGGTGSTGTVFQVNGSIGQLFSINNTLTGVIYQVSDISGIPIIQVNSNGALYMNSVNQSNITPSLSPFPLMQIDKTTGEACYFDYRIKDTNGYTRAGTVISVWDPILNTTELTDVCTPDLGGNTSPVYFSTLISGSDLILNLNILSGTWSAKIGARVI